MNSLELIGCAKINFNNFTKMNPQVKSHPIFVIAMEQLTGGFEQLEKEMEERGSGRGQSEKA